MLGNLYQMNRETVLTSALLTLEMYGRRSHFAPLPQIIVGPYSIYR